MSGSAGYHAARAAKVLGLAVALALASSLAPHGARAHTVDLSRSDVVLDDDGRASLRIVLASKDAARVAPLDADGDGVVRPDEIVRAERELAAFVGRALSLSADGEACRVTTTMRASADEVDGVALEGAYACAPDARELSLVATLSDELGPRHKHLATLQAGDRTAARLLEASSRRVALELPSRPPPSRPRWRLLAGVGAGVALAVGALALFRARRRRG